MMRLGDIEALVLLVVENEAESARYGMVPRGGLTLRVMLAMQAAGRTIPRTPRALIAAVSRAITGLCEKRILQGFYQAWHCWCGWNGPAERWYGMGTMPLNNDDKRATRAKWARPRLRYVRLARTEDGRDDTPELRAALTSPEVNTWAAALGYATM